MGWLDDLPDGHPLHRMAAGKPPFEMTPEERLERQLQTIPVLPVDRVWSDAWALLHGNYFLTAMTYDPVRDERLLADYDWSVLVAAFKATQTPEQMSQIVAALQRIGADPSYVITRNGLDERLQAHLLWLLRLAAT